LAIRCPFCDGCACHVVRDKALGNGHPCPKCGNTLHLNSFTINADWRPIAGRQRAE
jgi:hypothetical protein